MRKRWIELTINYAKDIYPLGYKLGFDDLSLEEREEFQELCTIYKFNADDCECIAIRYNGGQE